MQFLKFRCSEYFRTPAGVGYELCEDVPQEGRPREFERAKLISVVGYIDVHWNATTHIKIYITVLLNDQKAEGVSLPTLQEAVEAFIQQNGLNKKSTYEARLVPTRKYIVAENREDENGRVDAVS